MLKITSNNNDNEIYHFKEILCALPLKSHESIFKLEWIHIYFNYNQEEAPK